MNSNLTFEEVLMMNSDNIVACDIDARVIIHNRKFVYLGNLGIFAFCIVRWRNGRFHIIKDRHQNGTLEALSKLAGGKLKYCGSMGFGEIKFENKEDELAYILKWGDQ